MQHLTMNMNAVVYRKYGPPEVLEVEEVEIPQPRANEILVKVAAVEATKSDCELRSFHFAVKWFTIPLRFVLGVFHPRRKILGGYFSGVVEEVGAAVTKFKPGNEIFGSTQLRLGGYGEYLCVPETYCVVEKPTNLSHSQAAAVPLGGLNALHFMRRATIHAGEQVLIIGAGASIGTFGVQIAKRFGAEVTVVDAPHKEEMLRRIGADHFIDYTKQHFADSEKRYDVIFNMVASTAFSDGMKCLKEGGRYLTANPKFSDVIRAMLLPKSFQKKAIVTFAAETEEELVALKKMIEADQIAPVIDRVYSIEQAAEAHMRVEKEERVGCVVLSGWTGLC